MSTTNALNRTLVVNSCPLSSPRVRSSTCSYFNQQVTVKTTTTTTPPAQLPIALNAAAASGTTSTESAATEATSLTQKSNVHMQKVDGQANYRDKTQAAGVATVAVTATAVSSMTTDHQQFASASDNHDLLASKEARAPFRSVQCQTTTDTGAEVSVAKSSSASQTSSVAHRGQHQLEHNNGSFDCDGGLSNNRCRQQSLASCGDRLCSRHSHRAVAEWRMNGGILDSEMESLCASTTTRSARSQQSTMFRSPMAVTSERRPRQPGRMYGPDPCAYGVAAEYRGHCDLKSATGHRHYGIPTKHRSKSLPGAQTSRRKKQKKFLIEGPYQEVECDNDDDGDDDDITVVTALSSVASNAANGYGSTVTGLWSSYRTSDGYRDMVADFTDFTDDDATTVVSADSSLVTRQTKSRERVATVQGNTLASIRHHESAESEDQLPVKLGGKSSVAKSFNGEQSVSGQRSVPDRTRLMETLQQRLPPVTASADDVGMTSDGLAPSSRNTNTIDIQCGSHSITISVNPTLNSETWRTADFDRRKESTEVDRIQSTTDTADDDNDVRDQIEPLERDPLNDRPAKKNDVRAKRGRRLAATSPTAVDVEAVAERDVSMTSPAAENPQKMQVAGSSQLRKKNRKVAKPATDQSIAKPTNHLTIEKQLNKYGIRCGTVRDLQTAPVAHSSDNDEVNSNS